MHWRTAHCSVAPVYAAVVLDAFSRQVLGLSIADHLRAEPTRGAGSRHRDDQASCGTSSPSLGSSLTAPVMMATASAGVCDLGVMTPAPRPRRWMWMRSATSKTLGMLWLIRMMP